MSSKNNPHITKYLYITDPLLETVKDSQVINWIQLLDEKNVHFDLIIPTTLYYLFFKNRLRKNKIKKARKNIAGKIIQLPIIKRRDRTGISTMLLKSYLGILVTFNHGRYEKIIIQTRNFTFVQVLKSIKGRFKKVRIIYDMRGAAAEEYINSNGYVDADTIPDPAILNRYKAILHKQKKMISLSDRVLCVSDKLRHYAAGLNTPKNLDEFITIPGAADESVFFFNPELRHKVRARYHIENSLVLIYSGKLDRPWHKSDFVFSLVSSLLHINSRIFFFCFTPDIGRAEILIKKYQINEDNFLLKYEENENLNSYYNGADLGLMIRDDIPTNNVASPTKLPEYLLSGLPVIISKNLGDYTEFVEKNELGFIVENKEEDISKLFPIDGSFHFDRKYISNIASSFLSKQSKIKDLVSVYSELQ